MFKLASIYILVPYAVMLCYLFSINSANAAQYSVHIEGKIMEKPVPNLYFKTNSATEKTFTVDVDNNKWFIRVLLLNPAYSTAIETHGTNVAFDLTPDSWIASSDGDFFYYYISSETHINKMIELGKIKEDRKFITKQLIRGHGPFPYRVSEDIIMLWYAFASHFYFERVAKRDFLPPMQTVSSRHFQTNNYHIPGYWKLLDAPPRLPNYLITSNLNIGSREYGELDLLFKKGKPNTNSVYETLETLYVGEYLIPKTATLKIFSYLPPRLGLSNYHAKTYSIYVDKANIGCNNVDFIPNIKGPMFFTDLSFLSNKTAVGFVVTNNIPGVDLIKNVAEKKAIRNNMRKHHTFSAGTVIIVFVILTLPIFIFIGRKITTRKKDNYI